MKRFPLLLIALVLACLGGPSATTALAEAASVPSLWHPMREALTDFGRDIDRLYWVIFFITSITFVVVQLLMLLFLFRYRATEGGKAVFTHGNAKLELAWTITPAIILVFIAFVSRFTWDEIRVDIPEDAVKVEVIAQQFSWFVRYSGNDGEFGPRDFEKLRADRAASNTVDAWAVTLPETWPDEWPEDQPPPPGLDDYKIERELRVPADRPVRIVLTSNDVLHSFFIPEFRIKHDAVPGMNGGRLWFNVAWEDVKDRNFFDIICAELCGLTHYAMWGRLIVMKSGPVDPEAIEMSGEDLMNMMYDDPEEFDRRFKGRDTTWDTYVHVMSKITVAENSDTGY